MTTGADEWQRARARQNAASRSTTQKLASPPMALVQGESTTFDFACASTWVGLNHQGRHSPAAHSFA